jgi:hypothetical protein
MDGGTECNNTQSSADLWGHEDPGLLSFSWYISPNNMWERARGIILREGVPFLCSGLHITCSAGLVLAVGSSHTARTPLSLSFSLNTYTHKRKKGASKHTPVASSACANPNWGKLPCARPPAASRSPCMLLPDPWRVYYGGDVSTPRTMITAS